MKLFRCLLCIAVVFVSACGCAEGEYLQTKEVLEQEQMMAAAEKILTDNMREELESGDLDYLEILDVSYVDTNSKCNVVCTYKAAYAGEDEPMLTVTIERDFMIERDDLGNYINTASEGSYRMIEEDAEMRNAEGKITYPPEVPFHPVILKTNVEKMSLENICEELLCLFFQELETKSSERTFRITEYRNVEVKSLYETVGERWEKDYWYSFHDVIPDGAVTCWIPNAEFEYKYLGGIRILGYEGAAFEKNRTDWWFSSPFQDSTFVVVEWPDCYELYTSETLDTF